MAKTVLSGQNNLTKKQLNDNNPAEFSLDELGLMLENTLDNLPQSILIIDVDHTVRYINREYSQIAGISAQEARGKKCHDLFPNQYCHTPQCQLDRIRGSEKSVHSKITTVNPGGGRTSYFVSAFPLFDSDKNIIGIIESFREDNQVSDTEARLRETEEQCKTLIALGDSTGEAVVILQDLNGMKARHVFVSSRWLEITGYSRKDLSEMSFLDLIPDDLKPMATEKYKNIKSKKVKPVLTESTIMNKKGCLVPIEYTAATTTFQGKKAVIACIKDISRKKQLEKEVSDHNNRLETLVAERTNQLQQAINKSDIEAKKRKAAEKRASQDKKALQELLDATPAGIYLVDRQGQLVYTNKAGVKSIGKPIEEILGKTAYENHPERENARSATLADFRVMKTGIPERSIFTNYEPLHERWFTLDRYPYRDSKGNILGVIIVEVEITDRINIENRLKKLLKQEQALQAELKEQSEQRIEFTRALVHELKTPLTPLLVSSDYLAENLTEEPYISFARNIQLGANNLSKRISELLDIARGEVGILKLERKYLYPRAFLKKIYSFMLPEAERNGLHFNLSINGKLPMVFVDAGRIQQVLLNLLNNSFKFTRRNGTVNLKAEAQNSNIVFEIEDTGCGISQEAQRTLFRPYNRQKNMGDALGGLGLGLFLSKMLVELHGGKIWLESTRGKGSRFFFSIPTDNQGNDNK